MRVVRVAAAIALAVSILIAWHFYVWLRLVIDPGWPEGVTLAGTVLMALLCLSGPGTFFLERWLPQGAQRVVLYPFFLWMGVGFLLLVSLGALDLLRLAIEIPSRTVAAIALGVTAVLTLVAMVSAARPVVVRDVAVPIPALPDSLHAATIVQLTDVHVGPLLGRRFIEQMVAVANSLSPDVVAITGDLVDGPVARLADDVAPLAELRARHGVFFVTGNHEYYAEMDAVRGADDWIAHLASLGIRTLRNEHVRAGDLDVAGIDDHSAGRFGHRGHGPDLARAVAGRDPARPLLLLAHQPKAIHDAARHGVTLQLSGHTHDGQIWPFRYLVYLQQPYVAGLARHRDTWIYVSRGTGYWGPPMRLLAPAEITRLILRRESGSLPRERSDPHEGQ